MTNTKPAPPVPSDVDLRGYEHMPLYGGRLYGSDFNARVTDAGFRAALSLWWQAWMQVPASSLPNDEVILTKLADLGRDLRTFRRIRDEALDGFVECDDGRLYHPQLAVWAIEAWDRRVKDRQRKAQWRAVRERDGTGTRGVTERGQTVGQDGDGTGTGGGTGRGQGVGQDGSVPSEVKRGEVKRGEAMGGDLENRDVELNPDISGRATPPKPANGNFAIEKIVENQNQSQRRKGGQDWSDPAYVAATAKALGVDRRTGEADNDFKDRVYSAVQAKIRSAAAQLGHRA